MNTIARIVPFKSLAVFAALLLSLLSEPCLALTIEVPLSRDYIQQHPKEWSLNITKKENDLLQFKVTRILAAPKYLVAHLSVRHAGKVVMESDSPAFGRKGDNTLYFSISPEDLGDSKFDLSENGLSGSGDDALPIPGAMIYQFPLLDFAQK